MQLKVDRGFYLLDRSNEIPAVTLVVPIIKCAHISAIREFRNDHKSAHLRGVQRLKQRRCMHPFIAMQPPNEQSLRITAAECDSPCHYRASSLLDLHIDVPVLSVQGACIHADNVS